MDRIFTNWESSVYASASLVPRVKLFTSCTSRTQLAQLETVLATLADSDEPKTEKEMEKEMEKERVQRGRLGGQRRRRVHMIRLCCRDWWCWQRSRHLPLAVCVGNAVAEGYACGRVGERTWSGFK